MMEERYEDEKGKSKKQSRLPTHNISKKNDPGQRSRATLMFSQRNNPYCELLQISTGKINSFLLNIQTIAYFFCNIFYICIRTLNKYI